MRLYNTYLGPASDTLLDLGALTFRWNNFFVYGTSSLGTVTAASGVFTNEFSTSGQIVGLISTGVTADNIIIKDTASIAYLFSSSGIRLTRVNSSSIPTSSIEADIWNDSRRRTIIYYVNSIQQMLSSTLYTASTNQAVSNTETETTLIGSGRGALRLPPNYMVNGKTLRLTATGLLSTQLTPPTLNVRVRLGGGTITGSAILVTGDQTPTGSLTNVFWRVVADLVCYTSGATGTIIGQSVFEHMTGLTGNPTFWEMVTSPVITLSTTTDLTIQLTADWGAGVAAGDSMNCTNFTLESLN